MINYWQSKKLNFGTIKRNSSKKFEFVGLISMPEVVNVIVGCGCLKPTFNPDTRILSVIFNAGEIPNHIEGNQEVLKMINIYYKNGEADVLTIEGTKTRE